MNDVNAQVLLFNVVTTIIPLILAIAVHEWAHVAMARFLGDRTGEERGRLTLNPLAHADPIWTVAVPTFFVIMQTLNGARFPVPFFGAGRPAPYSPLRLDRRFGGKRISMGLGELLVAAAGPLSNLVMAGLSALLLLALLDPQVGLSDPRSPAVLVFKFLSMNVGLFLFNLIPVPPLDGSKVVFNLLPRPLAVRYAHVADKLSFFLLAFLFLGGARYVIGPIHGAIVGLLLSILPV